MALLEYGLVILAIVSMVEGQDGFTINVNPTRVIELKGKPVNIDCTTTGTIETPTITWLFEKNPIVFNSGVEVLNNNTLHIKSLTKAYRGEYTCQAKTASASAYALVKVDFAVLKKIPPMPNDYEFINKKINITCPKPSRSMPAPSIRWETTGNIPLPVDARIMTQGWSLIISNLKTTDTNNYTCVLENMAAIRRQTMHLQVYIARGLTISAKKSENVEGSNVMFTCASIATPPFPSRYITWVKKSDKNVPSTTLSTNQHHTIYSNGTLKFTSLVPSDKGNYQCKITMAKLTSHYEVAFSLQVLEKLKINKRVHQSQQNLDRAVKKNHSVDCAFFGDGPVTVKWTKKGLKELPMRMKPNGYALTIQQLKLSDSGEYTCLANGKYNSIVAVVKVYVFEGSQFTTKPKNITLKEGESGKTICEGKGIPKPKISWVKADAPSQDKLPANFKVVNNKSLVVDNAVLSNSGEYFCVLANGLSSNSVVFYVNVNKSGDKGSPKGGQQSMGRTVGIAVGCAGAYIVLVIGLMIYCRSRRSRMLKRQGNVMTEIEDGEFNKDLLENGDDGYPLNGGVTNLEKWQFPREDLEELTVLGHGKLGKMYTAKARGILDGGMETLVAVKQLAKGEESSREAFDSELDMLAQLKHYNVIKLLGVCTNEYPLLIVTEYSEQGDLKGCLNGSSKSDNNRPSSINTSQKLSICTQIAKGMEYLSVNRIIHQDLACRNCLVLSKDFDVKVAFFSLSEDLYKDDYFMFNGTHVPLRWLSPEALFDENYSEQSGVWAFGVAVWEVYSTCKQPYPDRSNEDIVKRLRKDLKLEKPSGCPDELFTLVKNCCRTNPDERPKFSEIVKSITEIPIDSNV